MYGNYRKSFYRGDRREFGEDRPGEDRWHDEGRGWRDRYRGGRFESDREWSGRNRESEQHQAVGPVEREVTEPRSPARAQTSATPH